jgi:hypothetical protein
MSTSAACPDCQSRRTTIKLLAAWAGVLGATGGVLAGGAALIAAIFD